MANNKAFKVKNGLELEAYSKAISDTAVDIFVYDTRKDSDSGRWRKRTQHTSWYNETLNTATRGSRKEFPSVAVIVAEAQQVTIYDGDDPDLPMWMVFNSGTVTFIERTGGNVSCVEMLNGTLCVGKANGYYLSRIEFILDKGMSYSSGNEYIHSGKAVADRNVISDTRIVSNTEVELVNAAVNDVAMTVLPNAPIDAATGLPVPTIAVATDGGVSVIRDDGTVVDVTESSGPNSTHAIEFTDDNKIVFMWSDTSGIDDYPHIGVMPIPSADVSQTYYYSSSFIEEDYSYSSAFIKPDGPVNVPSADAGSDFRALARNKSVGYTSGLSHLYSNPSDVRGSMVSYTTSSYNTGWMNGAIKLATLSDTDATNVTGAELVTNGTFDSDTSGWTADGSGDITFSSVGSTLQIVRGSGNVAGAAYQAVTVEVGKTYTFSANVTSGTMSVRVGTAISGNQYKDLNTQTGEMSCTFTATSTTVYITLWPQSPSTTANIDNISVRLAEEDRSVNGNGLQVFGTVTKSAVATGADLVAYSGFSGSNYLEQPYNSDLDFGTGDFSIMGWLKFTSDNAYDIVLDRGYYTGGSYSGNGFNFISGGNNTISFRNNTTGIVSISAQPTNVWLHLCTVRRNGVVYAYINGGQQATVANTTDFTNTNATLRVGLNQVGDVPANASQLALFRISATAPSPEQIAKIYEDEKFLFQENAQATLYGSSDAVTALAYDDTTELLHVGTSAGRSVFQGLRRVDNTTTAVGAAISASNGLVADE